MDEETILSVQDQLDFADPIGNSIAKAGKQKETEAVTRQLRSIS